MVGVDKFGVILPLLRRSSAFTHVYAGMTEVASNNGIMAHWCNAGKISHEVFRRPICPLRHREKT